jgi:hypothetical protein
MMSSTNFASFVEVRYSQVPLHRFFLSQPSTLDQLIQAVAVK